MAGEAPIEHDPRWPVVSLGEIAIKIGSGATPKGGADAYLPTRERYALVRSQNVFDRRFDPGGLAFITDEQADGLRGVVLQPGDILLNITGDGVTFGRACTVPSDVLPACVNQHVSIIRVDARRADPGYVLGFLTHPHVKSYIESFNAGGSRRAVTKGHIESFRLPLPPLSEQRAIAHILGTLDDKIELNRRMSETLEAMARALFKSWFIDFDPVRAKGEGRDPGLPPDLAGLFPSEFEESELGEIPKGWRVLGLAEVAHFTKGVSYRSDELADSEVAMVTLKSFRRDGGYKEDGLKPFVGRFKPDQVIAPGEVVVAHTDVTQAADVLGRAVRVPRAERFTTLVASLDAVIVRPAAQVPQAFIASLLATPRFQEHARSHANGTTVLHLSAKALPAFEFCCPPAGLATTFAEIANPMLARSDAANEESRTLAELRDTLLPKLISGELRVPDAERLLERSDIT